MLSMHNLMINLMTDLMTLETGFDYGSRTMGSLNFRRTKKILLVPKKT